VKIVFYLNHNGRAKVIHDAVLQGLARHGRQVTTRHPADFRKSGVEADIAIFYGLWDELREIQRAYPKAGRTSILIDLGYWGRIEGGKLAGYHRVSVNALHATGYFQRVKHPPDRFLRFGLEPRAFRRGGAHVLLCGMSGKAAWVYGLRPEQWERDAVEKLRFHSRVPREIRYRPKQSWKEASPIAGAVFAPDKQLLGMDQLNDCWALVTHHGNAALDALLAGVPVFCEEGLASVLAERDLARINTPRYPSEAERDQLLFDAAWTQWKVSEIAAGEMWNYLAAESLIPW